MATLKDVAKETGLTVSTVSRVLNNRGYISEETRKKVYEAMKSSAFAFQTDDEHDRCDRAAHQTSVFCGADQ